MKHQNFLVLVRHGQSEWNAKNLFTGWKDPGLTPTGEKEAFEACLLYTSPRPRDLSTYPMQYCA